MKQGQKTAAAILSDVLAIIKRDVKAIAELEPTVTTIESLSATVARYGKLLADISESEATALKEKNKSLAALTTEELVKTLPPELKNVYDAAVKNMWAQENKDE